MYSLLSGGMAAFILLPAYHGIMATAAGDMAIPKEMCIRDSSTYYEADLEQAKLALAAYPQGLQIGGGINADNAEQFLDMRCV